MNEIHFSSLMLKKIVRLTHICCHQRSCHASRVVVTRDCIVPFYNSLPHWKCQSFDPHSVVCRVTLKNNNNKKSIKTTATEVYRNLLPNSMDLALYGVIHDNKNCRRCLSCMVCWAISSVQFANSVTLQCILWKKKSFNHLIIWNDLIIWFVVQLCHIVFYLVEINGMPF